MGRTWLAILENYQQADGSVLIPEPAPYMGGRKNRGSLIASTTSHALTSRSRTQAGFASSYFYWTYPRGNLSLRRDGDADSGFHLYYASLWDYGDKPACWRGRRIRFK